MAPLPSGHLGSHGSLPPGVTERRDGEEDDALTDDEDAEPMDALTTDGFAEGMTIDDHIDEGICPFCDEDEVPDDERTFEGRQGVLAHARQRHEYEYEHYMKQREDEDE